MDNKNVEVMTSSENQTWGTPDFLFKKLNELYGPFTLDAAASDENSKCMAYFTEIDDSLKQNWFGKTWVNPPYSRGIGKWLKKGVEEARKGATVVMLVPSRTGSVWFQEAVKEATEVLFLKGRVTFEIAPGQPVLDKKGKPMAAPFDNCIFVFTPSKPVTCKISWWAWKD